MMIKSKPAFFAVQVLSVFVCCNFFPGRTYAFVPSRLPLRPTRLSGTILSEEESQPNSPLKVPSTTRTKVSKVATKLNIISPSRQRLKELEWKSPSDDQVTHWLKQYGEASRYYRRDVFTPGDWVRMRRSTRYWASLKSTFKSGLIRQIAPEVTVLAACSAFVLFYNHVLVQGWSIWGGRFIAGLAPFLPVLRLPLAPFTLASASLGLLLTFRTNVSYQRWNEARTAWGRVINDSRSLARMGCIWGRSYNPQQVDKRMLQKLGDAICSFSRSLMNRTLPHQEDEQNFLSYLYKHISPNNPQYAQILKSAKHRPTAALAEITSLLVQMQLHPLHQVEIEKMATELCSSMGACERILSSPVPTFYPRHTARFLAVWLLGLPWALFDIVPAAWNHFALIPIMVLLGGFLLGIEELSNQLEEPFSILPMEKMCETSIRIPVMEQVQRSQDGHQAAYVGYPLHTGL